MSDVQLILGDCLEVMATMEANSVDAIVCDPPAGIAFMGKSWDKDKGGRKQWIAWMTEVAAESLRVIRPGGHAFVWALPKTAHWTTTAWEDGGWEVREKFYHLFGQGFPKSKNVSGDLLGLPWCACSCVGHVAGTGAELTTIGNEGDATTHADVRVALDSSRSNTLSLIEGSTLPSQGISASVRAGGASGLTRGLATDDAKRNGGGLESSRSTGHGGSAMEGRNENIIGQRAPVMFRPFDVTSMTAGDEITINVGGIQDQPETLRNHMVGNQVEDTSAVNTSPVPSDNGFGDISPSMPFIRPLATAPGRISDPASTAFVVDSHTSATAIDRGLTSLADVFAEVRAAHNTSEDLGAATEVAASSPLEQNSLGGITASCGAVFSSAITASELDSAVLASFGNHSHIIRQLVSERKVLVCAKCGKPMRPEWIIDGLGSATKPAVEEWLLLRKPLSEPTIAANVLRWGTGALAIDKCRIGTNGGCKSDTEYTGGDTTNCYGRGLNDQRSERSPGLGRWPANLLLDDETAALLDAQSGERKVGGERASYSTAGNAGLYAQGGRSLVGYGDTGGASRYFKIIKPDADDADEPLRMRYEPKASRKDRNEGLEGMELQVGKRTQAGGDDTRGRPLPVNANHHPTVKSTQLCRWLVRLITPPGGVVLDPFLGSGSTLKGAVLEGFSGVGIELDPEYLAIADKRIAWAMAQVEAQAQMPLLELV